MNLPFLRDFPDVIDIRTVEISDDFQSEPLKHTVISNIHKYTGMDEKNIKQIKKYLEKTGKEQ